MVESVTSPTVNIISAHVLEIWAIVLVILGAVILMGFLMFGPALSIIIYRVWRYPLPRNEA